MKKLFSIALLVWLCAVILGAGQGILVSPTAAVGSPPVFVFGSEFVTSQNGGTSSAINTTGANFFQVCVTHNSGANTALTDSPGNTYTNIRDDFISGSSTENDLYYIYNPT